METLKRFKHDYCVSVSLIEVIRGRVIVISRMVARIKRNEGPRVSQIMPPIIGATTLVMPANKPRIPYCEGISSGVIAPMMTIRMTVSKPRKRAGRIKK
jgi:hypothetical protein